MSNTADGWARWSFHIAHWIWHPGSIHDFKSYVSGLMEEWSMNECFLKKKGKTKPENLKKKIKFKSFSLSDKSTQFMLIGWGSESKKSLEVGRY